MTTSNGPEGPSRRRRIGLWLLAIAAIVAAVTAYVSARSDSEEHVAQMWLTATVADDGSTRVVEVIDYDFGTNLRHGIFRTIPDLSADAPIDVSSPDAPDDVDVSNIPGFIPKITIGDPDETVSGLHRYVLEYTLDGVAPDGAFAWDAVGNDWGVPIDDVEVHVLSTTALDSPGCVYGLVSASTHCRITQSEPGHLVAHVDHLRRGAGVTVSARLGSAVDSAPGTPEQPAIAAGAPGSSPFLTALVVAVVAVLVGVGGARLLRRAGREPLPSVGVPDLPGAGDQARVDLEELAKHASPSAELPEGLTPAQGGVLLVDSVANQHKAAWLLDRAADGGIDLETEPGRARKDVVLVRKDEGTEGDHLLDLAFRGRERIPLGRYDRDFAAAWKALGEDLTRWRLTSDLWDRKAATRATLIRMAGFFVGIGGILLAAVGGSVAARTDVAGLLVAAAGGAVTGAGFSAAISGWELRRLTPEGSATWLRVASLQRYFRQSALDVEPVDEALVGKYTAWALALGEAAAWSRLTSRAAATARDRGDDRFVTIRAYHWTTVAPSLAATCGATSVSPSSSSSGGGGGGGHVGGGGGGGGGGSW